MTEQRRSPGLGFLAVALLSCLCSGCASMPSLSVGKTWNMPWLAKRGDGSKALASQALEECDTCESKSVSPDDEGHSPLPGGPLSKISERVKPAAFTDYPPGQNPDTAYAAAGPVHSGSELVPRQKMASEIALELKAENERLKVESRQMELRLKKLEDRLATLEDEVVSARGEAHEARKSLRNMGQELKEWQEQTVEIYTAVKRSEQQVLDSLQSLTLLVERMIEVQQSEEESEQGTAAEVLKQREAADDNDAAAKTPGLLPSSAVHVSQVHPATYQLKEE